MLSIESVNHVGIRVSDRDRSVSFYETLGFENLGDVGFDQGHPVIMKHPSGVVLNLLGPAGAGDGRKRGSRCRSVNCRRTASRASS